MIVYCITNMINGKKYIGMTGRTLDERWNAHCSGARNGSPFRFHSAIRKYGEHNFRREVLYENLSIEECRTIEESTIREYDTMVSGYNAKPGGGGGWIVPDEKYNEWLQKVSNSSYLENNGRWSGYSDNFILEECVKIFHQYENKEDFTFADLLNKVREKHSGIPKHFSKNRFSKSGGFNNALADRLQMSLEDLKRLSNTKSNRHRLSLSIANTGNSWYSNDILKISKQSKNHPGDGWYKGRKYGNKN